MPGNNLSIPLTLFRDLPLHTGSLDSSTAVVAVLGNGNTVRFPVESMASEWVRWTGDTPAGAGAEGFQGELAICNGDSDVAGGFYCYFDNSWGRVPVYCEDNWGDLTGSTRFLRVDAEMNLGDDEFANVRRTLSIGTATTSTEGLVMASGAGSGDCQVLVDSNGVLTVGKATSGVYGAVKVDDGHDDTSVVSLGYLKDTLAGREREVYHIATRDEPGLVLANEEGGPFQVDQAGNVIIHNAEPGDNEHTGLLMLSRDSLNPPNSVDQENTVRTAASVRRVQLMIEDAILTQAGVSATEGTLGSVMVPGDGCLRIITDNTPPETIPGYGTDRQWKSGSIDVNPADTSKHGAVVVRNESLGADHIDEKVEKNGKRYFIVPTAKEVRRFVDASLSNVVKTEEGHISRDNLPLATADDPGIMSAGSGLLVNSGIVTVRKSAATPLEVVNPFSEYEQMSGAVYTCCTDDEYQSASPPMVPTLEKVKEIVAGGVEPIDPEDSAWPEVAVSTDVSTGIASIAWEPRKFFIVPSGAQAVNVSPPTVYKGYTESMMKWTPPAGVHSLDETGVLNGVVVDASRSAAVIPGLTYLIRLAHVSNRLVVASIHASFAG